MENLEHRLMTGALGEHRMSPDEQRQFLGTYAERVVLSILLEDAKNENVIQSFSSILQTLKETYTPLKIKISPSLSDQLQITYMKIAKENGLPACIVEELKGQTPFGILIFSDHAVNVEKQDIHLAFPELFQEKKPVAKDKETFWHKLFH